MSMLAESLSNLENAVVDLETRVKQKIEDAEKKDVPTEEDLSRLTAIVDKIKNLYH